MSEEGRGSSHGSQPNSFRGGRGGFRGGRGGFRIGQSRQPSAPYNPAVARFKKQNPGSGPHGFGGTYKKGEKGGFRPYARPGEDVPLAERGLQRGRPQQREENKPRWQSKSPAAAPQKGGTSALKSKIRDITRLLQKPGLDELVKKHKSHELAGLKRALDERVKENAAAKIDAKYKVIKFYERRKIVRKLEKLRKKLASMYSRTAGDIMTTEEKTIRKEIAKWQEDLDYVDYFPHGVKYVSLFRNPGESKKKKDKTGSDSEDEPDVSESEGEEESKNAVSLAEQQKALDAKRAEIRKQVAKIKAAKAREERGDAAARPAKRKRDDSKVKDELFEEEEEEHASSSSDADENEEMKESENVTKKHSRKQKPQRKDESCSDDDSEQMETEEATPAPPAKKQPQKGKQENGARSERGAEMNQHQNKKQKMQHGESKQHGS